MSIPKPKAEWTVADIEEVHKDKKAMNILFNGLDQDMFDNVINSKTAKEIWDNVQLICEGTEQVRENKMQLLIQQYEYFHFEEGESLNDTFNRFQKLLNGLKLYGRVYQVKDSNLKFLRSLPNKWKPMTVSLRNSQEYKDFTLERLYGILKTYELEMEQDELLEKRKRKGGSVALVANSEKVEARNEEKTMPSLKIGTSKSESSKGKEQVAEDEDNSSQDDSDDIDEHLAFLSRRFVKMKFRKNTKFTKPNKNMVDKSKFKYYNCGMSGHFASECRKPTSDKKKFEQVDYKKKYFDLLKQKERAFLTQDDWAADGINEDDDMEYVNLALMANSDENETSSSSNLDQVIELEKIKLKCLTVESELEEAVKKVEILSKQLESEQEVIKAWKTSRDVSVQIAKQEVIKAWKTSRDVSVQIAKVQGIESFCENTWKKNKKELELIDGLLTDVESTDDESYPLKEEKEHPLNDHQLKQASNFKNKNLNKKDDSTFKNFVKEGANTSKDASKVNIGHMTLDQLKNRLKLVMDKKETKRKSKRNWKVGINKYNNYTPDSMPQMIYNMPMWNNIFAQSMPYQIQSNVLNDSVTNPTLPPTTSEIKVDPKLPKSKDAGGIKSRKKTNKGKRRNLWYLNSGCSRHMTEDFTLLTEFKERTGLSITFGDDNKGFTMGYGLISKENVIIDEFALVDGLKHNLLTISQLCDRGNTVSFNSEACIVTSKKDNKVVLTGVRKGNVYLADFSSTDAESITYLFSKTSVVESWLYNKKLSHLNFKTMNDLVKKDIVRGMPLVEFIGDGLCDACQKGKKKKVSFSKKLESAIDEPLQLLHMELFGPVNVLSISRKRYCLVIVDDFSKFSWVYFLGSKDEASEIIINHIKQVNNHPDFKVRNIRSDNGTEFKNSTMKLFCEENGIMHEFSAPRTPQQNSVVEWKNRSLIEAARTMLEESKLPTYFWAEAVNCVCYTQNISLINQAKGMTPYQLFKRRKPTLNFLYVFGCKCYILRNQFDHKGKFDAKADEGIFVGYSAGKSYMVYNLRTNIVMKYVHVVFDDKKIDGLTNEGHHEGLKFDNIEIYCDDTSIERSNAASVERQSASSVEVHNEASVDHSLSTDNQFTSSVDRAPNSFQRISNSGGVSTNQHSISHHDNTEATSSRANLPPQKKWTKNHPFELIIGDVTSKGQTKRATQDECLYSRFLSQEEPKRVEEALLDPDWILAMQEELNQFERNKSAFLNGELEEEVYVSQPPGFEDPNFPDYVYYLLKALYGLKQAPRAWYETLSKFLLDNHFTRGTVAKTLFFRNVNGSKILVQIYVDDIIFGSTDDKLCKKFAKLMQSKYEMSMMGELTYFLGLQVKQVSGGIFISQTKYIYDLLKKFDLMDCSSAKTLMATATKLELNKAEKSVDISSYRGMVDSLLYLTASRPDIMFSTCLCARFQADPKESHLVAIKRIFTYLKGTPNLGIWYPRESGFDLIGYSDADYAGCKIDRKSTTGTCQFLGNKLVSWFSKKQNFVSTSTAEPEYIATGSCCAQILWMRNQLFDYGLTVDRIPIFCDNTSAIAITENPVQHSRNKHIDIKYHFIREHVMKALVEKNEAHSDYHKMMDFIKNCKLSYAMLEALTIYCEVIEEIWITAEFNSTNMTIAFSLKGKDYCINCDDIQSCFKWPENNAMTPHTDKDVSAMLDSIGYTFDSASLGSIRRKGLRKE
ncbi:hypothetical protein AgCh_002420 [Apium graveolens]